VIEYYNNTFNYGFLIFVSWNNEYWHVRLQ